MKNPIFKLKASYTPAGSQPEAIRALASSRPGSSVLLGVTGSGKTFTIANVIAQQDKPVLILAPNKTLAAQLYEEFSTFFPDNKVCYFVSYYDYYQPESYLPAQDIYIPKETKVNAEIERLRVEATASLANRRDTIIIASVSCIYSLGNPSDYKNLALSLTTGQTLNRKQFIDHLISIQYKRNDTQKENGTFQVLGNTIEINLPYLRDRLRLEFFGDTLEGLSWIDKHNNHVIKQLDNTVIFPAKHFVMTPAARDRAIVSIQKELNAQLPRMDNPIYRERLKMRVSHDLEMLQESGYCSGIENYSSHFDGRLTGQPPFCLFDFFGDDFLTIIDESHIAMPQLRGMYAGDRARKKTLVDFGFRLPSAYDNRPLKFDEIERYFRDVIYVSATPGEYELKVSNNIVEQIIRPTGLVDPQIIVKPREGQLDTLIAEIHATKKQGFRTLITVLTKKLAEELARYLEEHQLNVCYLHSEIKTPQRTELLQKLRAGIFDCLVGVNLLREGLDLPEVALVAIMDGDIESFLRDKRSLIQTIGRAARNTESKVLIFADTITQSMRAAIDETERRRTLQQAYNQQHGIVPVTVKREVNKSIVNIQEAIAKASARKRVKEKVLTPAEQTAKIAALRKAMHKAVEELDFEHAITLRNELQRLEIISDKK